MGFPVSGHGADFDSKLIMQKFDVAVVGAGPAGSAAAISLSRRGYLVALLDKQRFPREKLCGDFVNPANWPVFRKLGVEKKPKFPYHQEMATRFSASGCAGLLWIIFC